MALKIFGFIQGFVLFSLAWSCTADHTFLWSFTDGVRTHLTFAASANSLVYQFIWCIPCTVSADIQSSYRMRQLENQCPTSCHSQYNHLRFFRIRPILSYGIWAWWVHYHFVYWNGLLESHLAGQSCSRLVETELHQHNKPLRFVQESNWCWVWRIPSETLAELVVNSIMNFIL